MYDMNAYNQSKCDSYNKKEGNLKYYDCPICKNKGAIAYIVNDDVAFKDCECRNIRRSKQIIHNSGLEKQIEKCRFDNFKETSDFQKVLKTKALEFLNTVDGWFMACGQVGSGKTHICTAIIADLINKGNFCLYMNWRDDITKLKHVVNTDEYSKMINRYKTCNVLYIDDLFKGKITEADINIAFEILNYRYNNNLKTIISGEKTIEELIDIDEAIGSRIKECADNFLVQVSKNISKNYRMKK